ncbi:carbohydrate-binding protein [Actinoplanes sp. NPDC049265]|uniref:carbohydrate-binding protein n=1 Tax=Actinoplanes sp. NPDC049265 TaxID=3363902 RepID=UPI0037135970
MSATVYKSRSRALRNRLLIAAGVVVLLVVGWLLGRSSAAPPAVSAPATSRPPSPSPSPSPSEAPPAVKVTLQVEDAAEVSGAEMQDTSDSGGGKNAGWINNGDYLRFDDVDFGASPLASVNVRIASDSDKDGRIEIRVDDKKNPPVATLNTARTGGWQNWVTQTTDLSPVTGRHTVYVTFGNAVPDDFVNVNWLEFRPPAPAS